LSQFGFEASWHETVLQMLRDVLSVPLDPDKSGVQSCHRCLRPRRLHELEFSFSAELSYVEAAASGFAVQRSVEFPTALAGGFGELDFVPVRGP
jgi:hypothetical protein